MEIWPGASWPVSSRFPRDSLLETIGHCSGASWAVSFSFYCFLLFPKTFKNAGTCYHRLTGQGPPRGPGGGASPPRTPPKPGGLRPPDPPGGLGGMGGMGGMGDGGMVTIHGMVTTRGMVTIRDMVTIRGMVTIRDRVWDC